MPPKKGIVKSGNSGNSSKATSSKTPAELPKPEEKPLFPPGSKYPLILLRERAQKEGWHKPVVNTYKRHGGFSFAVTLSRLNKKREFESVRLEPHPPFLLPTALEAQHWGATYALYRFCNGISLHLVLPPGPREYWQQLAVEHRNVPEHQKWEYDADPFAARKAFDQRQEKTIKKKEERKGTTVSGTSPEYQHAPEAKMASSLRDLVEETIKQAFEQFPEAADPKSNVLEKDQKPTLSQQLKTVGFSQKQADSAIQALSQPSALTSTLLASAAPLQACLEYLVMHVPECDLPQRFMPQANSSNPFVSSVHAGTEDIKARWIVDKLVKECGFPSHAVKPIVAARLNDEHWGYALQKLNRLLIGNEGHPETTTPDMEAIDEDELQSWGAHFCDDTHLELPLPVAPLRLHVILPDKQRLLPRYGDPPPLYISSTSAAAYIRLHIMSKLVLAFWNNTLVEEGESIVMAAIRFIEEEWAKIEDDGPPDMSDVLRYFMRPEKIAGGADDDLVYTSSGRSNKARTRRSAATRDSRSGAEVKAEFEQMQKKVKYVEMLAVRKRLPAFAAKDSFLKMLERNRCVVVVGETGCGKTTQLPQFVLDSLIHEGKGSEASIIITQPRRLAAIGVASRVSAERLEDGSVGYAIRGENKQSKKTKLLFCTTGIVLRRLGSGDKLQDITHVIVDEVHERSVDGDILLLELKTLLKQHPKLKVILMSATINHDIFVKYFGNAPLLTIPGFAHPVQDRYLEDYLPSLSYRPGGKPAKGLSQKDKEAMLSEFADSAVDESCIATLHAISRAEKIDPELIASVVKHITTNAADPGGILIFLPGVLEIQQCVNALRDIPNAKVFPLHANLSSDEQRAVFATTPGWKVIAATNVAETSITIDDVVYVIDSGKVKETQYDPENGLTKLVEQWVTRAAAKQRRGRAGRTRPGICYKLFTRKQEEKMSPYPIPEIRRVALESVALAVKVTHDDAKGFLSRAIDPPSTPAVEHALGTLVQLGALSEDGNVTAMGQHLAMLPVDLRLGKMLVMGATFRCLGPVLTVAAILSSKPMFYSPMDRREEANQARARFATSNSDLLTDAHAYDECVQLRSEGFSRVRSFCEDNFISTSTLRDVTSLRQEFLSTLTSLNLVPQGSTPTSANLNTHSSHTGLVKAVVLAGLWPRVARVHLPPGAIKFDRVQAGSIQRANEAKEYKFYDIRTGEAGGRVFLHPASILFHSAEWKSPFVAYFQKQSTTKVYLRDATEVPIYALLLFGGPITVNHIGGGLTIGNRDAFVKLKAWPRIGVLVNQLRRLLDAQLKRCVDDGNVLNVGDNNPVVRAVLSLLEGDGLTGQLEN